MRSTPLSVRVQRLVAVDAANLIKPLLSSGKIRVIGSTTYQEFSNILRKTVLWRVASRKLILLNRQSKKLFKSSMA